jgi:Uma2 family endonuclease
MVTTAAQRPFDPLVDLAGIWTTTFAERYLPIDGAPPVKYECIDGKLVMSPYEASPNGYGMLRLAMLIDSPVRAAGCRVYPSVNLIFGAQRWIQPDITVLNRAQPGVWVPSGDALLVGEFISPSSRIRDRIDKPALCAEAGVPYYLLAKTDLAQEFASLRLLRLVQGEYVPVAEATVGERFEVAEPFEVSFDPVELLDL